MADVRDIAGSDSTPHRDDTGAVVRERLRAALRERYVVEREIGRGATAIVYLARDLKHKRSVAIKVLHPDLGRSLAAERFVREIETAARLTHPHILAVFDSGQEDDLLYYVMPYVEGESLRERLRREQRFPVDEAVRICREVADALDYAHLHGVVHRDIKPANILLVDGRHALVADFGLARAIEQAGGDQLTASGLALGTPLYMSPEQAGGERELDRRTDVYSLACVLYEMLAGEPPFRGSTAQAIVMRHLVDAPRSPRETRAEIPTTIDRAVLKALSKAPVDRFASAGELVRALPTMSTSSMDEVTIASPAARHRYSWTLRAWLGAPGGLAAIAAIALGIRQVSDRATTVSDQYAVFPFQHDGEPLPRLHGEDCEVLLRDALERRWTGIALVDPFAIG